jgi:MFS family permease
MDRRLLILGLSAVGAVTMLAGVWLSGSFPALLVLGFVVGGAANPLYSLSIAYTNDYLGSEDMAAASAGLLFINGVGAIGGPIMVGRLMEWFGPPGFFLFLAVLLGLLAGYAIWRMARRKRLNVEAGAFIAIAPTATMATSIGAVYEEEAAHREAEPVAKPA